MSVDDPHTPPAAGAQAATEPIAITGMSGRFASAPGVAALWNMLIGGTDAIVEIPPDRYDIEAVYDPTPRTPGRTISRWGGLLEDIAHFDAEFFGISPREADRMDPQQRLLLEVAYEALEDAGQPVAELAGSDTGVFVGQLGGDYWHLQTQHADRLDLYAMTGAASRAITSGRLSYAFDLRGPSFTVDTACSSALVAVHNAVQALRLGECGLAIAGAVNLVLLPQEGVVYSGAGMLAGDGRCKFGDASGDGFVRSDGVGAVVLKPLSRALADGDRVRAVIRGSAVGNDGQSSGYLVTPGVDGQREVLERAYRNAGVDPAEVDYVEAHGTGTSVGDPVELQALATVLGAGRPADRPCLVGSVKTNIGHAEAAAGIAGLLKAVLCLEHGRVPASLHLRAPNPAVSWDTLPLHIPTRTTTLPDRGRPALAGVSSFGFSGTNAHLVLEAAPPGGGPTGAGDERAELLTLSARSPEALAALARRTADHLAHGAGATARLLDVAHSAAVRRSHHEARLAVPVTTHAQAVAALRGFADGADEPGLCYADYVDPAARPRVAFVFPGQGSQWIGMGRTLLTGEPAFAAAMAECDRAIQAEAGWSVSALLRTGDEARLAELDVVQPTLWAMEVALATLWRSWGVEPDVVIGHSMGEAAAAQVAGALSLADAAAVICRRSRLAKRLSGRGAMAWVALSAADAAAALAGHEDAVAIAAANSPTSTLLSGESEALAEVLAALDARGVPQRLVRVDFASHCPQMDALRGDLLAELRDLAPAPGRIPLHSTLLNRVVDGSGLDAEYWARNIREPVDFVGAVRAQLELGPTVFVEVSPHPLLVAGVRETGRAGGWETVAVGSLRRDADEREALLTASGALHTAAVPLAWRALTEGGRYVPLPHYPWQRARHWLPEPAPATAPPAAEPTAGVKLNGGKPTAGADLNAGAEPTAGAEPGARDELSAGAGPAAIGVVSAAAGAGPTARRGGPAATPAESAPPPAHPLLGPELAAVGAPRTWEAPLDLERNAYLRDHQVQGTVIVPGTAHLEALAAAARAVVGEVPLSLTDVRYHHAIFLDAAVPAPLLRVTVAPAPGGELRCRLLTRAAEGAEWTQHTEATARAIEDPVPTDAEPFSSIRRRCPEHQRGADFYPWHAARGNQWIGAFQGISELWRSDGEVLARLTCPAPLRDALAEHHFHPALLDASGHAMAAARPPFGPGQEHGFVLGGIDEVRYYRRPGTEVWSHARLVPTDRADSFAADLAIRDDDGDLLAEMRGLRLQYLAGHAPTAPATSPAPPTDAPSGPAVGPPATGADVATAREWLYDLVWEQARERSASAPPASAGTWIVLTDSGAGGRGLVRDLTRRGHRAVVVTASAGPLAGGPDRYRVDPTRPEDYAAVLADVARTGPCRGIVHLWALDAQVGLDATRTEIARAQTLVCHSVLHLTRALEEHDLGNPPLFLVTQQAQRTRPDETVRNPFQAALWGLGRTLAAEHPARSTHLIDLDRSAQSGTALPGVLDQPHGEDQLALRDGRRLVARLLPRDRALAAGPAPGAEPAALRLTQPEPGVIDDLVLGADAGPLRPGAADVVIRVTHAALNYRDVLLSVGLYPGQDASAPVLGWECAGVVEAIGQDVTDVAVGDPVIALAQGALATRVVTRACLTAPRPAKLTPAEAATLPAAYLTAYHALHDLAGLGQGDRLLIHSATGGTGLAAWNIAQWRGAVVHATAGSTDKRAFLENLGVRHVADSRSLGFAQAFRPRPGERGFDVILNTLAGTAVEANLSLMAPYGHYLELSKRDILDDAPLGRAPFAANLSFHGVDVVHMIQHVPHRAGRVLRAVARLVAHGVLRALPYREFPADHAVDAFRLMAQSRHIGKVVLSFEDVPRALPAPVATPPRRTVEVRADRTYLITGGAGGIGGQLATWLADQGARHLLLTGRSALPDPAVSTDPEHPQAAALRTLRELEARGVRVQYAAVDAADLPAMRALLDARAAQGRPPVRGVLHAAGVIDYAPLRELRPEQLDAVLAAKVSGGWNVHRLFGDTELDMFVLFSSGSALLGSPLLGGYAAGNAFLDALAHHRRAHGLPATVVNWGFWDGVGMVARKEREEERTLLPRGMSSFSPQEGLAVLGQLLAEDAPQTAVLRVDWPAWAEAYPDAASAPLLSHLTGDPAPGRPGSGTANRPAPGAPGLPRPMARVTPEPAVRAPRPEPGPPPTRPEPVAPPRRPAPPGPAAPCGAPEPPATPAAPAAGGADGRPSGVDVRAVEGFLREQAAVVLGLRGERVHSARPLNKMGMDSLMAVELRSRIEREYRVKLPMVQLLKGGTITSVAQAIVNEVHSTATSA